jgi:hypothetical protein
MGRTEGALRVEGGGEGVRSKEERERKGRK